MSLRWWQALLLNFLLMTGIGFLFTLVWKGEESIPYILSLLLSDAFLFDFTIGSLSALLLLLILMIMDRLGWAALPKNRYTDLLLQWVKEPAGPFLIALTASVSEEFLFRGVLLPLLILFMPAWPSLLSISLLFMLLHIPQYAGRWIIDLFIFASAILFGLFFLWRGNLIAPIFGHFFYNLGTSYWVRREVNRYR